MEFDEVLKTVGEFGRVQKSNFLLLASLNGFMAMQMLALAFVGKEPPHVFCADSPISKLHPCSPKARPCSHYTYSKEFTSIVSEVSHVIRQNHVLVALSSPSTSSSPELGVRFGLRMDQGLIACQITN